MKYNKEWAVEAAKQGVQAMAFYGHVQTGETVDASCLSQWFPCSFVVEEATYTTAEQYMMAEKAGCRSSGSGTPWPASAWGAR